MFTPLETKSRAPRDMMFLTGLKRKILITIFGIFILSIFFLLNFIQRQYVYPILMYHSVNPDAVSENRLAVSVNAFQRQMHFLKTHRYNVLPLEDMVKLIKDGKKISPRTVSITFDDGYKDSYTYVFRILKKYEFPAKMFIIVNEVGRPDRLSWDEIKAMQDSGLITFGSHSLGPEPLINIKSETELKEEIFNSKKILENKLGKEITAFSYPEGRFSPKIKQLVMDAGYKLAVTTSPGRKFPDDDIFALKRLRISSSSDNLVVFWVETSGFYTFIKERRDED